MQYAIGMTGRIIAARLFEGEDVYECIESIAVKEDIRCASVLVTGGFRKADVVVGPESEKPKIVPKFMHFTGPGEVLGVGTLYNDDKGPKLHLHAAIGKNGESLIGCPRKDAKTFLVLEVTIIEIAGIEASRKYDAEKGLNLLDIE
ncbi:MAG TPA: DUF296 domain-containing protein [Sedimentisphaerales bacterium]|nr:DUF296 domain-containing protein [Sedimentisphaerales bacterium]